MTQQALSLTTFYAGWGTFQRNVIKVIAPLTPEQLALPVAPHHWPIGIVAQHIVANRVWWFQVWMGEGSPDLAPIAHWDPQDTEAVPPRNAAELVAGFEATWHMIETALARWTPADLGQLFPPPAEMDEEWRAVSPERTRQWIIWHVLEHEILHSGELSLALGTYNLPTIYGL